jgi:hypothetical protein
MRLVRRESFRVFNGQTDQLITREPARASVLQVRQYERSLW